MDVRVKIMLLKRREEMVSLPFVQFLCSYDKLNMVSLFLHCISLSILKSLLWSILYISHYCFILFFFNVVFSKITQFFSQVLPWPWNITQPPNLTLRSHVNESSWKAKWNNTITLYNISLTFSLLRSSLLSESHDNSFSWILYFYLTYLQPVISILQPCMLWSYTNYSCVYPCLIRAYDCLGVELHHQHSLVLINDIATYTQGTKVTNHVWV